MYSMTHSRIDARMLAVITAVAMAFSLVATMSLAGVAQAATVTLTADLTAEAEVPEPGPEGATGTAALTIDDETGEICFELKIDGLEEGDTVVAAHIHAGEAGVAGDVVVPLFTEPTDDMTGCVEATDLELVADIIANPGEYYVNIHTELYPGGAVRGQLTVEAAPGGGESETGMLMIMKHYCNADDSNPDTTVDVRSEEEFKEVEAGGGGDPIVAVALTVLACPVERLPGDEPVSDTIAHFEEEFDFLVTDSTGAEFTLADATFTNLHACEADDGRDPLVLGEVDGDESTNVCVDFSFYAIDGVAEGEVTVVETFHEGEHEFGTVRFTPKEVDPDDDSQTLIGFDRETSTVNIDTSLDGDGMVMLHVYNFDTAAAAAQPTPTPAATAMPDAAIPSSDGAAPNAAIFGLIALLLAAVSGVLIAGGRRA